MSEVPQYQYTFFGPEACLKKLTHMHDVDAVIDDRQWIMGKEVLSLLNSNTFPEPGFTRIRPDIKLDTELETITMRLDYTEHDGVTIAIAGGVMSVTIKPVKVMRTPSGG